MVFQLESKAFLMEVLLIFSLLKFHHLNDYQTTYRKNTIYLYFIN